MTDDVDSIPSRLLLNVFQVFCWAIQDTVRELDHVEHREDITAENFLAAVERNLQQLESEAAGLGIPWRYVADLADTALRGAVEPLDHPRTGRANLRLVWPPPDQEDPEDPS